MLTVVVVEPGKRPYLKEIPPGLKSLRREVGGKIEATFLENGVYAISDEFAKLTGKPLNRSLRRDLSPGGRGGGTLCLSPQQFDEKIYISF